jgi:plastocyanin
MKSLHLGKWLLVAVTLACGAGHAQGVPSPAPAAELRLHIVSSLPGKTRAVPAVIWLDASPGTAAPSFFPHGHYTLLQKNRMFIPHLQVVPVGSQVQFPNADPFFHNVFSLFDGKRFDLGLYEAGSSKSVTFSREGVSYIFCNIHPEMSAVIVTLSTPLFAIADRSDAFVLRDIPSGDYKLHFWIEGVPQSVLAGLDRRVHLPPHAVDLGAIQAPISSIPPHKNKFGDAYPPETPSTY